MFVYNLTHLYFIAPLSLLSFRGRKKERERGQKLLLLFLHSLARSFAFTSRRQLNTVDSEVIEINKRERTREEREKARAQWVASSVQGSQAINTRRSIRSHLQLVIFLFVLHFFQSGKDDLLI